MQIESVAIDNPLDWEADALIVGLYEDEGLSRAAVLLDASLDGVIQRLYDREDVSGKKYKTTPLLGFAAGRAGQIVTVGLGKRAEFNAGTAFRAAAAVARQLSDRKRGRVALFLDTELPGPVLRAAMAGVEVGSCGQDLYRAEKKRFPIETLVVPGADPAEMQAANALASSINLTRRLVNEPPSVINPVGFAEQAERVAQECALELEIWDEHKLAEQRCGAMLAVARGSHAPPRLVILKYQGAGQGDTVALVGKGVTFDSGGLSLKPSDGMKTMKCDMAGAATVLGTMRAIAKLRLPVNVIGLMGLVENMPGHNAYRLGDVLTTRNGTTIEVLNTDAEGRLVLADVLNVAVEFGADRIIDLATLTGACVVALGTDVAGLMTNNQAWCDQVRQAAERAGERVWQLPMFPEYGEQIKSEIADIKNVGNGRWGGAITAAKLLEVFVDERPWVHIDIAGPAYLETAKPWLDAGGTGALVPTLVELLAKPIG